MNDSQENIEILNYAVTDIKRTENNKIVDVSNSLLCFVNTLPEYSCKNKYESKQSFFSLPKSLSNLLK